MQTFVNRHFLSVKDSGRFVLFVVAAMFLLLIGAANKTHSLQLLPAENQIIDSKPKQSGIPQMEQHKPIASELDKV
jgi:hypothetical protein